MRGIIEIKGDKQPCMFYKKLKSTKKIRKNGAETGKNAFGSLVLEFEALQMV